jgi:hypothetical protein
MCQLSYWQWKWPSHTMQVSCSLVETYWYFRGYARWRPISVATWSKVWVYSRLLAGIVGLNPAGGLDVCQCCVLSGRGLCDGLIIHPEKSYWLWCIGVCDLETSRTRRPSPVLCCSAMGGMLDGGSTFPRNVSKCLPDSHSMRGQ